MANKKMGLTEYEAYVNSESFVTDFSIRRVGENNYTWVIYHPEANKKIEWINGRPYNVKWAEEFHGCDMGLAVCIVEKSDLTKHCKKEVKFEPYYSSVRDGWNSAMCTIADFVSTLPIVRCNNCDSYEEVLPF